MELSPRIVSPCSDLARVPYFVLAETLAKVRFFSKPKETLRMDLTNQCDFNRGTGTSRTTLLQELRKVAADAHQAKEAAADREQLQSEVASLQAANLRILSELTARNTELEDKRRMLQEQVRCHRFWQCFRVSRFQRNQTFVEHALCSFQEEALQIPTFFVIRATRNAWLDL
jgi:DNA anti-recombination protein RmuC